MTFRSLNALSVANSFFKNDFKNENSIDSTPMIVVFYSIDSHKTHFGRSVGHDFDGEDGFAVSRVHQ